MPMFMFVFIQHEHENEHLRGHVHEYGDVSVRVHDNNDF
jgi:hypothetical protein